MQILVVCLMLDYLIHIPLHLLKYLVQLHIKSLESVQTDFPTDRSSPRVQTWRGRYKFQQKHVPPKSLVKHKYKLKIMEGVGLGSVFGVLFQIRLGYTYLGYRVATPAGLGLRKYGHNKVMVPRMGQLYEKNNG